MSEENKAVVRRLVEARNANDHSVCDELVDESWHLVNATLPSEKTGPAAMKDAFERAMNDFPDSRMIIEDQIAEGDKVVTRYAWEAIYQLPFVQSRLARGLSPDSPDSRELRFTGVMIERVVGGKVVETWETQDALGLLRQVGALPG
jgi:predicted ester cyclase